METESDNYYPRLGDSAEFKGKKIGDFQGINDDAFRIPLLSIKTEADRRRETWFKAAPAATILCGIQ